MRFSLLPLSFLVFLSSVNAQESPTAPAAPSAIETQIEQAFADFSERAVESLSAGKSPRERWTAAWMLLGESARASGDVARAKELRGRADKLFQEALNDGMSDPVVLSWAMLDPPVPEGADAQTVATARLIILEKLREIEPDNGMVWVAALPGFGEPGGIPEGMRLLAKAAASKRFDSHFSESLRELVLAYSRIAPPKDWPDTRGVPGWEGMQAQDVAAVMAVGVANAVSMPYLAEVHAWCKDSKPQPWYDDCVKLARLMGEKGDALVVRSLGIGMLTQLSATDAKETARISALRRDLGWIAEMGMQKVGPGSAISYSQWLKAWSAPKADEFSVGKALLRLQKLPETPPKSYVPAWERNALETAPEAP